MNYRRNIAVPFSHSNSEKCKHCGHDQVVADKVKPMMPIIRKALAKLIPGIKEPFTESHLSAKVKGDTIIITIKCPKADMQAGI